MSWFVLTIKKNQEDKVEETLRAIGIEVFNPVVKGLRYWSDRKKIVKTPLFKSHIFVKLEEKYRGVIFGVSGVKGYLFSEGKPVFVSNEEVNIIKQWLLEDDYDVDMLNKLISKKEVSIEEWFSVNNINIKPIGKRDVSHLIENMDTLLKKNLRDVV